MFQTTYNVEAPFPQHKLNQIELFRKELKGKYGFTDNEINHRFLCRNYESYKSSFFQRTIECDSEINGYINAIRDNMIYEVENMPEEIEDENVRRYLE